MDRNNQELINEVKEKINSLKENIICFEKAKNSQLTPFLIQLAEIDIISKNLDKIPFNDKEEYISSLNTRIQKINKEMNRNNDYFNVNIKELNDKLERYSSIIVKDTEKEVFVKDLIIETNWQFYKNNNLKLDINLSKDEKYLELINQLKNSPDNQELDKFEKDIKRIKNLLKQTRISILKDPLNSLDSFHRLCSSRENYKKFIRNIRSHTEYRDLIHKKKRLRLNIEMLEMDLKKNFDKRLKSTLDYIIKIDCKNCEGSGYLGGFPSHKFILNNQCPLPPFCDLCGNLRRSYFLYKVKTCSDNSHPDNCNNCINGKIYYL